MTKQVKIRRNGARNLWTVVAEIHKSLRRLGTLEWFSWIIKVEVQGGWIIYEVQKPDV